MGARFFRGTLDSVSHQELLTGAGAKQKPETANSFLQKTQMKSVNAFFKRSNINDLKKKFWLRLSCGDSKGKILTDISFSRLCFS